MRQTLDILDEKSRKKYAKRLDVKLKSRNRNRLDASKEQPRVEEKATMEFSDFAFCEFEK